MDEPNSTGAQKAAFQRAVEEQLIKYVRTIELRKWSVEKAAAIWIAQQPPPIESEGKLTYTDPILLAAGIYDFVRSE